MAWFRKAFPKRVAKGVRECFDAAFYLENNPDVRSSGMDPLTHYLRYGWKDSRDPSPTFSTSVYLKQFPYLRDKGICPLVHYVECGRPDMVAMTEISAPKVTATETSAPNLAAQAQAGLWNDQLRELLRLAGFDTGPFDNVQLGRFALHMFSAEAYRAQKNLPQATAPLELLTRYLAFDLPAGMPPGPLFDSTFYAHELIRRNMSAAEEPPFLDWLKRGVEARISPTPAFDSNAYLMLNPDLRTYPGWLFEHWLLNGLSEGRQFSRSITFAGLAATKGSRDNRYVGRRFAEDKASAAEVAEIEAFRDGCFGSLIEKTRAIDPAIGPIPANIPSFLPPFHDEAYLLLQRCLEQLPAGTFDTVVLMPFCKMGGADFVAGILSHALTRRGNRVIVLRTEQSDWARPDWFPGEIPSVDLSTGLKAAPGAMRPRMLYEVLRHLGAERIFNVNSRLGFETFESFGTRLGHWARLYCYYFCADRTPDNVEVGYPVQYFASIQAHLDGALIDNADLARTLVRRHCLPPDQAGRVHLLYSPAMGEPITGPVAHQQIATRPKRKRPRILWAGRLDRQKRFDLVIEIARELPDWDFLCWGKEVLDKRPDTSALPSNLMLNEPYTELDELPLEDCDGWLYTSSWDGLPTILIEVASIGMPIVASEVGGVPELIDDTTGWPVPADGDAWAYAVALRNMMMDDDHRLAKATALQNRARTRHTLPAYEQALGAILEGTT